MVFPFKLSPRLYKATASPRNRRFDPARTGGGRAGHPPSCPSYALRRPPIEVLFRPHRGHHAGRTRPAGDARLSPPQQLDPPLRLGASSAPAGCGPREGRRRPSRAFRARRLFFTCPGARRWARAPRRAARGCAATPFARRTGRRREQRRASQAAAAAGRGRASGQDDQRVRDRSGLARTHAKVVAALQQQLDVNS
jgi:hypothetical protein